ncbi:4Fe-4S binding protein [Natroniella sulfidigena]|uniref:ATP-binding protein n=1 Tax=Natroniella sulfidigena TaxID=723921 RepID=UPI00200B210A|nr:4Fe-4S binding protein [Natroniella sulfidigena]MCK8817219.1 4Fe-4S binding protein [Natroniella sulfidigena]
MPKRQVIKIDENKCNGCGECVTGCQEGALQIVDGVAKLVNESFCDGFGDCIGECPTGALEIIEREAEDFDLKATVEHVKNVRGEDAVKEMLKAQEAHGEEVPEELKEMFGEACGCLDHDQGDHGHGNGYHGHGHHAQGGCPGSRMMEMKKSQAEESEDTEEVEVQSQLQQWPVQIHLLSPQAPYFKNADLMITADCVPVAYANYHQKMLKGNAVAIGCPKLDDANAYVERLAAIIEQNDLNSITVARMEVPCCGGLVQIAQQAAKKAGTDLEVETTVVSVDGKLRG